MTVADEKLFTPDEANQMLPLVRRIVEDILAIGVKMKAIGAEPDPTPEQVTDYNKFTDELQALFAELGSLGCAYKDWDFTVGLVDWPSVIDGERVLLCWRNDEPAVAYYHSYEDGYAGRREIPASDLNLAPPAT
jgi:hypothetical protein